MSHASAPDLLVLHAVRLAGMADDAAVARRFGLDPSFVEETLLDHQAYGWVTPSSFAGTGGWSLTPAGRVEDERRLAAELRAADEADGHPAHPGHAGGVAVAAVRGVHTDFLPLNDRLLRACTDWQLRPTAGDPLAENDHGDPLWDGRVLGDLADVEAGLGPLVARLVAVLERFRGYDERFSTALHRATTGDPTWVAGVGPDSCHGVWMELHEDLIATLGLSRGG